MPDPKTQVTVSIKKTPDYKIHPATGVFGGPTTDGNIMIHFMVEHAAIPNYQVINIDEAGTHKRGEILDSVTSGDGERTLVCGIMLSPNTALAISNWLRTHAKNLGAKDNDE